MLFRVDLDFKSIKQKCCDRMCVVVYNFCYFKTSPGTRWKLLVAKGRVVLPWVLPSTLTGEVVSKLRKGRRKVTAGNWPCK